MSRKILPYLCVVSAVTLSAPALAAKPVLTVYTYDSFAEIGRASCRERV